jgi:polysaccharide deacetylase family protein (PEP-CTERM system associated)
MKNILTFDVEDYFQVENFKTIITKERWTACESRVHIGIGIILSILAHYDVRATFFVLGWIAERHPALIEEIREKGHEIGTHGYAHDLVYNQSPGVFRNDLERSIEILEKITKGPIESYRAPSFSITEKSLWAFDILMECGIRYDSSLFPIRHHRYGIPNATRFPHVIRAHDGKTLVEFPISTCEIHGTRIPFSGGGYFRLLPARLVAGITTRMNRKNHPVVIYLHPWEFDPGQPRIGASRLSRFRQYHNLQRTETKLRYCLDRIDAQPLRTYWEENQKY